MNSKNFLEHKRVTSIEVDIVPLLIRDVKARNTKDCIENHPRWTRQIGQNPEPSFDAAYQGIKPRPCSGNRGFIGVNRGNKIESEQVCVLINH